MKGRYSNIVFHIYHRFEHGFTLIEILVALVIVSVGVLALGSFSLAILASGQISRERLIAVHFAEQFIEEWQKTDIVPTLDSNYCKPAVTWTKPKLPIKPPIKPICPKSTTTSVATCIPLFGTKLSYKISAIESPVCGPPKTGGNTFVSFKAATPPYPPNTKDPKTKLVRVSWTRRGKPRAVFLTHVSRVP